VSKRADCKTREADAPSRKVEGGSLGEKSMASKIANRKVKRAMHEMKRGKLKSGKSGTTVKSRKQAIAIGLSEARKAGAKIPKKKTPRSKR
jgi:hypothetical protein